MAEKLGKTVRELETTMSNRELLEWHMYFDPESWRKRVSYHETQKSTPEQRSQALLKLITGANHG